MDVGITMDSIKAQLTRGILAMCALALVTMAFSAQAQNRFYRYTNDRGITVITETMPPEDIMRGYEVISRSGTLIETVPRQLTEEELRNQSTEEARARLRKEEALRLQAWDEMLMLRYSSIEDIEAARGRAIRDLQIRISILKSNLMAVKNQIEREQQKAADIERAGGEAPENLANIIDKLGREVEDTEESIAVRRQEVEEAKASYQRDIERFVLLSDRVKIRSEAR